MELKLGSKMKNMDKDLKERILQDKQDFTKDELMHLVDGNFDFKTKDSYGSYDIVSAYIKVEDKIFEITYKFDTIGYDYHRDFSQPIEVEQYKEVITVTKYRPIKK